MPISKPICNAAPSAHLNLSQARCGERLKIVDLRKDSPATARLRELGFCESAEVCKVADRGACICVLLGTRVAIGPELASHVLVERVRH
jgi:ferrous iron transport protein A